MSAEVTEPNSWFVSLARRVNDTSVCAKRVARAWATARSSAALAAAAFFSCSICFLLPAVTARASLRGNR